MRAIFGLVLIVGIALAGGAVVMAKNYLAGMEQALQAERQKDSVPTTTVMVATRALRYGEPLTQDAVRMVRWPVDAIPEGAYPDPGTLFPADESRERIVLRAIEKDEAVLAPKVTAPGEDAGITSRLASGTRALAIRVDVTSGVSGFLRPGDRVDVYWTGTPRDSEGDVTRMIEPGVQIVAVDQSANSDIDTTIARTITVAVRPEQVAALTLAQNTGKLTLALVGIDDGNPAEGGPIEINQRALLGRGAAEPAPLPRSEKTCTIRTRKGTEITDVTIPCTN
ncbi:Flp pilus assembly protein CpaB [Pontibaca methylaminivorans]|uniref:Pilus assembly protein CpaB n=1 Tax=Pontibaca methylaminivorans TaxID=515897 RepID=A0A1R3WLF8_9RHOB|nr:Flp pilus assembly protein CpaB [Pontibaca methylaminivorans]SIT78939.1 pilus assembly protein CpaB [Pontibaca methylaminivorans]